MTALAEREPLQSIRRYAMAGGEGAYPFFSELYKVLNKYGIQIDLYPIHNQYFGGNVNVAGLITGQDLIAQTQGKLQTDTLLIPKNMLRECEDVFLDGVTLSDVSEKLKVRVIPIENGTHMIETLFAGRDCTI